MLRLTAALAAAATLAAAPAAHAVHWPLLGGDAGRSGHQPVQPAQPPYASSYDKDGRSEQDVVTSIITTAGDPSVQRFAFATGNGHVHLQRLADGAPVGPEEGIDVTDHDTLRPFGGRAGAFADTSTPAGLGQLFVAHAETGPSLTDAALGLAQLDEQSGDLVRDARVAGTDGFLLRGPLLATGADAAGGRVLFLLAERGALATYEVRLFRIPVARAAARDAQVGAVTSTVVDEGTAESVATLAFVADGTGTTAPHVVVGVRGGVRSFRVSDLQEGPRATGLPGTITQVATPVTAAGLPPGSPMSGAPRAPFLLALADRGGNTQVVRLAQRGATLVQVAAGAELPGTPGAAFAVTQLAAADTAGSGWVVVPTSLGVFVLEAEGLATRGSFTDVRYVHHEEPEGFAQTAPAVAGEVAFIARDNGEQLALSLPAAKRLAGAQFDPGEGSRQATRSVGQPSLSRRSVQFAGDRGVSVYLGAAAAPAAPPAQPATPPPAAVPGPAAACAAVQTGTARADTLVGTSASDRLRGRAGDDVLLGRAGRDCLHGGRGDDVIHARGGGRDRVRCGRGFDVAYADARDSVRGCERVRRGRR